MARIKIIVPITIGVIFVLLFSSFHSLRQAALIILNLPFALIGGIVALWVTGEYLSVPASVGFINLFGVAVLNGIVLVSYMNTLRQQEGMDVQQAVLNGCVMRLRPVLMTAAVALLGLVPLALSQGIGSEVQRPLAVVVIGGLVSSTFLTLIVLPVLYQWMEGRAAVRALQRASQLSIDHRDGMVRIVLAVGVCRRVEQDRRDWLIWSLWLSGSSGFFCSSNQTNQINLTDSITVFRC